MQVQAQLIYHRGFQEKIPIEQITPENRPLRKKTFQRKNNFWKNSFDFLLRDIQNTDIF